MRTYRRMSYEDRLQIKAYLDVGLSKKSIASKLNVDHVSKLLVEKQWSPEQSAGRLKLDGVANISHETGERNP